MNGRVAGFIYRKGQVQSLGTACLLALVGLGFPAGAGAEERLTEDLSLQELIQRVLQRNESIQLRILELEINRRKHKAEKGIFEPELVTSAEHQDTRRETSSLDYFTGQTRIYEERNNIYNAGLESLLPTGARVRFGYTLRDLRNSIQDRPPSLFGPTTIFTNGEYSTFVGASLVQPLLKNAWMPATMASIRLAALTSEIAFQEYRRQLMLTLSTAEASYWNLYLAQEQMLFFRDSVALAETILNDNQSRLRIGKSSELEVLEAQAGLALRRSKQAEARQKFFEAVNRLTALYSESVITTNKLVIAADVPAVTDLPLSYFERWQAAFDLNPDYLLQRKRLTAENIRLAYAKNQRLPQLDLKASYGLNGLGDSPSDSWDDIQRGGFPSWSVGLEMRFPLGGGIKARNELDAAKLRQRQSLLSLKELEVQIANALDTALLKARSARDDVQNYQTVVDFSQNLLQTRVAELNLGKVESRKVLEVEADLLEAKSALADAKVRYQRALLELELIQGSLLDSRHLELTQRELEQRTAQIIRRGTLSDEDYHQFLREMQWAYLQKQPPMTPAAEHTARQLLRTQAAEMDQMLRPPRPLSPEDYERARRLLYQPIEAPDHPPPNR